MLSGQPVQGGGIGEKVRLQESLEHRTISGLGLGGMAPGQKDEPQTACQLLAP